MNKLKEFFGNKIVMAIEAIIMLVCGALLMFAKQDMDTIIKFISAGGLSIDAVFTLATAIFSKKAITTDKTE